MSDLPPDAARLRVLLRWLEDRIADNDTVGLYLRLQRDTVQKALDGAQDGTEDGQGRLPEVGSSGRASAAAAIPPAAADPRRPGKPFRLERTKTEHGPLPTAVHTADCHMAGDLAHAVNAVEARLALTDSGLPACQFCRPDTELGLDAD